MKKKVFDLYAVLQVHREATLKEIQKAFHALAKKCHPDIGGNLQEFQRINAAYEILCNPEKRQYYDRTGCIKQSDNETYAIVSKIIADTIEQFMQKNKKNIFQIDFVDSIKEVLKEQQTQIEKNRKIMRANIKLVGKLKKKITRKETDSNYPPILIQHFEQKKMEFVNILRQLNQNLSYNKIAILMLEEYNYDYDKVVNVPTYVEHHFNFDNGSTFSTTSSAF